MALSPMSKLLVTRLLLHSRNKVKKKATAHREDNVADPLAVRKGALV